MVALDGNINLIFLLYISFELRCLLVFSVAWEGELVADMSTAISDFVSRPHVFDHKRVSLPSLSGFYCTQFQTTETPKGPTPFYASSTSGYPHMPQKEKQVCACTPNYT